jgi:tRNA(Glu) U13 pseudouridine synthase TruD
MVTAFQRNAFQNDAFQIEPLPVDQSHGQRRRTWELIEEANNMRFYREDEEIVAVISFMLNNGVL